MDNKFIIICTFIQYCRQSLDKYKNYIEKHFNNKYYKLD